jgi:predicted dehydrogenase
MLRKKLKIGVIGIGYLGKFHLEKFINNKKSEVIWVVDKLIDNIDISIPEKISKIKDFKRIINDIDAVSIVTPTNTHYNIAKFFLENKKHVLIEKPMTKNINEAKKLINIAKKNKVILQVGHLERFNPVMKKLTSEIKSPLFIEVHRLAKFNPRSTDVNVIFDLMIHDIDIIMSLVKNKIKKITAFGKKIITKTTDIANVRIDFEGGIIANLTSSRISQKNERKIRIFEKEKYYSVDFMISSIKKYSKSKNTRNKLFNLHEYSYKKSDALKDEINNFILSCLKQAKPLVDGAQGMEAVKIASIISKQL